jgi:hypothetical protein
LGGRLAVAASDCVDAQTLSATSTTKKRKRIANPWRMPRRNVAPFYVAVQPIINARHMGGERQRDSSMA